MSPSSKFIALAAGSVSAVVLSVAALSTPAMSSQQQQCPATQKVNMPLKYKGGATTAEITACDLMTRLYIYADDSLLGRRFGTPDNFRATAYIEREVRRLGLLPAGDSGGYFQYLPVFERRLDSASTITVQGPGGQQFHGFTDFTANIAGSRSTPAAPAIFGGTANDTTELLTADAVRGKVLVLRAAAGGGFGGNRGGGGGGARGGARGAAPSAAMQAYQQMVASAAAVLTVANDAAPGGRGAAGAPGGGGGGRGRTGGPTPIFQDPAQQGGRGGGAGAQAAPSAATVQARVAEAIFGKPIDQVAKGAEGKAVAIDLELFERALPTRNVVAIIPGTDPRLKGQYVAIGAHNDHVGYTIGGGVEHDSLKAFEIVARPQGADNRGGGQLTDADWTRINAIKDSLRKIYPARLDSISNGADDDGSGSVSVLEIAEAFAKGAVKPKRSIIFVWHTGEEAGLYGSQWFTNHPTVPRDSIVAQLNMDMVGRGEATDATGNASSGGVLHGSPNYVQLVGSRRLSKELGDVVEQVNTTKNLGLQFDYSMDADGHPQNIYCRSDHANYARYGIPVVFFTTGGHADYHIVTDEPQYIQYPHMARVSQLVFDIAVEVAALDHRVALDKPKPTDPFARCVQ